MNNSDAELKKKKRLPLSLICLSLCPHNGKMMALGTKPETVTIFLEFKVFCTNGACVFTLIDRLIY